MEPYDHYKEARELAELLKKEGFEEKAKSILNAISGGSTGTEIFMALRWHLENFQNDSNVSISKEAKEKANQLFRQLNKALQ